MFMDAVAFAVKTTSLLWKPVNCLPAPRTSSKSFDACLRSEVLAPVGRRADLVDRTAPSRR